MTIKIKSVYSEISLNHFDINYKNLLELFKRKNLQKTILQEQNNCCLRYCQKKENFLNKRKII